MGFIIIAKGERKLFFWIEFLSNASFAALVWAGLREFGLKGTGMAFFALYLLNFIGLYLVVRRLSGFRWSAANRRLAVLLLPLVTTVFVSWYFLSPTGHHDLGRAADSVNRHLFGQNTLCADSVGTIPRTGPKCHFIFPAGAFASGTLNRLFLNFLNQIR